MVLQVLAPIQGGLPQQTGVIIQPQQIVLASGNKVQANTQVSTFALLYDTLCLKELLINLYVSCLVTSCQVMQAAAMAPQPTAAAAAQAQQVQQVQGVATPQVAPQPQSQTQAQTQQPPMMLQVDGAGDTSSEEDEDEEEEYDEDEEEEKDKDRGEDGQVEEVGLK